jgi:hypothetical protein
MSPEDFKVVGTSHHQKDLERLAGGRSSKSADVEVMAALLLEDDNPHDPKAVRVEIEGRAVGHLDRESARAFRRLLVKRGEEGMGILCPARIVGGWDKGGDDRGHFGVRLEWHEETGPEVAEAGSFPVDIDLSPGRKRRKERTSGGCIGKLFWLVVVVTIAYCLLSYRSK